MTHETVMGVFPTRERVEGAVDLLLSHGIDRAQVSLLASSEAVQQVEREGVVRSPEREEPLGEDDEWNVDRIVAGIPAYAAAVLAAGVTVASGGALAGVALAALGAGAAGGLAGAGAAKLLNDRVDARYEEQLARGGIVVLVSPMNDDQRTTAERILREQGAEHVGVHLVDDTNQQPTNATDSASWTGG
jgi:hypothetical protein